MLNQERMDKFRKLIGKVPAGVLSGVTVALILWLTLAPHPTGDLDLPLFPGADKVVHIVMFGFLTFVVLLELMKKKHWVPLPLPLIGIISFIIALFGIGIEVLQMKMGLGRTFEVLDILADTGGAVGMGGIWAAIQGVFAASQN